jgi:hypothetical protein
VEGAPIALETSKDAAPWNCERSVLTEVNVWARCRAYVNASANLSTLKSLGRVGPVAEGRVRRAAAAAEAGARDAIDGTHVPAPPPSPGRRPADRTLHTRRPSYAGRRLLVAGLQTSGEREVEDPCATKVFTWPGGHPSTPLSMAVGVRLSKGLRGMLWRGSLRSPRPHRRAPIFPRIPRSASRAQRHLAPPAHGEVCSSPARREVSESEEKAR